MLNNVTDVLSVVLRGSLGRSGRKRARRATSFLTGHRGFLSTSALIGAAGVAWGIYDTLKAKDQSAIMVPTVPEVPGVPGVQGASAIPPIPAAFEAALERVAILEHAREAGLESVVEAELAQTRQLADIVRGVTDPAIRKDLYVLAFAIVRADETVSGAERIYLAQLAHQLGLDPRKLEVPGRKRLEIDFGRPIQEILA